MYSSKLVIGAGVSGSSPLVGSLFLRWICRILGRCKGRGPSPVGVKGKVGALGRGTPIKVTSLGYSYEPHLTRAIIRSREASANECEERQRREDGTHNMPEVPRPCVHCPDVRKGRRAQLTH